MKNGFSCQEGSAVKGNTLSHLCLLPLLCQACDINTSEISSLTDIVKLNIVNREVECLKKGTTCASNTISAKTKHCYWCATSDKSSLLFQV